MDEHDARLARARISLEGLSVADALGGFFEFFGIEGGGRRVQERILPAPPWHYTDDTQMALSVFSVLRQHGKIDQDRLARSFAERYERTRGYGLAMHGHLARIREGMPWAEAAYSLFRGEGSYGNGSAMRVPPVGAYFADNLEAVVEQARLSAEVTHAHAEGLAGAIAVAVAAAWAWRLREGGSKPSRRNFIDLILPHVPKSKVREGIEHAQELAPDAPLTQAVYTLGNGSRETCQDTVPFVIWCAGQWLDSYEEAIWNTLSGGGDADTTCAMVGGIVALYTGIEAIPAPWIENREPLPDWAFSEQGL